MLTLLRACFILAVSALPAVAQQQQCLGALIQDHGEIDASSASSLALSRMFQRSSGSSSNWSAGLTVPIKGIPVKGNAESQRSAFEDLVSTLDVEWSSQQATSLSTQTLSREAVLAYKSCLQTLPQYGPRIIAYDATPSQVTVEIGWTSPPGAPTSAPAEIVVTGGQISSGGIPQSMQTGESRRFVIDRQPGKDVRVVANIGGMADSETVYHLPQVSVSVERKNEAYYDPSRNDLWRLANDGTGRESRMEQCLTAPDGWSFDADTVKMNVRDRVGHIDDRTYARIDSATPKQFCFSGRMYPLSKEGGGDIWFYPSYTLERVSVRIE